LLIRNADLRAPDTGAGLHDYHSQPQRRHAFLLAERLTIHGECAVESETVIRGGLVLHGADLRGGGRMDRAIIWNPHDPAVDLSQATLGSALNLEDAVIEGTVNVAQARIGGPLTLRNAQLTKPHDRRCLIGVGVRVEDDVMLRQLTATGGNVNFRSS